MSDPAGVLSRYEDVCEELEVKPSPFIMKVMDKEREDQIVDPKEEMNLELPGNNYLLTDTRLTDADAFHLYKTLVNNTYVVSLDLRYNDLTDNGAIHISKLLEETCALKYLSLMSNYLGAEGIKLIAQGLQMNDTLISLKLNGNKFGNKGGMALAGALQVNKTLEDLDIGDTDQDTQSMIAFSTVLNYNASLKSFCINRPLLFSQQEETTIHYAKMLKVNSTLTELHLQKCDIRDFGAERLAETLVENISLKYLDLSCNRIARDGAKSISKILKQNTPLEILDLSSNRIEDDGATFLSEAIATTNTNLKTLAITYNSINGAGLCAIAKAMEMKENFTSVFIWGNNLEENACVAFHNLVESGKLDPKLTDVKPYIVDGRVYLSELSHGLRRHYYWTPFFGPDVQKEED
ncbi:Leucine-rich repeat-containing protein 34 [Holothuria leucospilota]|uniref:Leucine-rich repeat-containing protein 34 n=1 Tax=Holothuria leucospilota TaxID=206669 RepID=A0A9Q0YFW8_HOLLE|nr:Leucine-rich repeat-containing protein 34 [Holothuria leucospilota]